MRHKIHSRKDFINLPFNHSDASIFSTILVSESTNDAGELTFVDINADLKIRDCHKVVQLSVFVDEDEQFENLNFKIDTLIEHLREFKDKYQVAFELYNERKLHVKKV